MAEDQISTLLLYVPLTDPTAPYHSLTYVATHARAQGFTGIAIRDTNIEALHHLARPEAVAALRDRCHAVRDALECRPTLAIHEQVRYRLALQGAALAPDVIVDAMDVLRSAETFFDYPLYRRAAQCLQNWLEVQAIDGIPGLFTRRFGLHPAAIYNPSSIHDLTDRATLRAAVGNFADFYEDVLLPELSAARPRLIGLNVTYLSQLPFALWLAQRLRETLPAVTLIAGGTEVTDVYKYAKRPRFDRVFAAFDACVVGEGESAFTQILAGLRDTGSIPADIANVVVPGESAQPAIRYEEIRALPAPDFRDIDFSLYLSPERLVYYSPTRGCYWNRCTFCDYGLSFGTPTSPWRQRSVPQIIEDLKQITRTARFVYFSVDVLAPGALVRLAEAIVAEGLDLRWAAEIRLERKFSAAACRIIKESGCVAVSFGFESAAQRILDLMDKGTSTETTRQILRAFADAGIAVQMMGFTGFPGETREEAEQTFAFLEETEKDWSVAGIGSFALTPGSIIAQSLGPDIEPSQAAAGGDFFSREFVQSDRADTNQDNESIFEERRRRIATAEFDRPFAGGIDTAHTIFFHDAVGLRFPRSVLAEGPTIAADAILGVNGAMISNVAFSTDGCADGEDIGRARCRIDPNMRLTAAGFLERLAAEPHLHRSSAPFTILAMTGGQLIVSDDDLAELLAFAMDRERRGIATLSGLAVDEELLVRAATAATLLVPRSWRARLRAA